MLEAALNGFHSPKGRLRITSLLRPRVSACDTSHGVTIQVRSRICSKGDACIMKKLILATLFLAVSSAVAFAADFNGKWTADIPSRQGGTMTTTFTLKVDGAKLTGTMSSQMGDADITNGKVVGDTITFDVVRTFGDNTITLTYTGNADGVDSIKFTRTMSGMPGGDGQGGAPPPQEFTAKRGAAN